MTLVKTGSVRRYWTSGTRLSQVADIMTREKFESITANLHFEDEKYCGRTKKFQLIVDRFNEIAGQLYMEENLSIDEQIIAYKGTKSSMRQYNPKKPKKWGWKIFALSGESGLIHAVEFYGQDVSIPVDGENVNKPGQVVLRLARNIPPGRNFKLFFDNWFNSPGVQVALALRQIWSIGTLMVNRAPGLKFENKSKPERGTYVCKVQKQQNINLFATQWWDNKPVTLLSTFVSASPEGNVKRYDRANQKYLNITSPACIAVYNKHMGYVDEINSYLGRFRVTTHCRARAYFKIFLNFVNIVATNCWIQYTRDCKKHQISKKERFPLYNFKARLAESLCLTDVALVHSRRSVLDQSICKRRQPGPRPNAPTNDLRLDDIGHWPIGVGSSERGGNCRIPGCKSKPVTKCSKCNVFLCITAKDCFLTFHTVKNL